MRLIDVEPIMDLLGIKESCEECAYACGEFCGRRGDFASVCVAICDAPIIEPERKKGMFIGTEYDGYADGNPVFCEWKCSECGCVFEDEKPTYNFCPNCGADMRKES